MKLLYVGRNARIGGGSTFRLNIGRGMLARGHQVSLSALGGPMVARYRAAGIRYHWVPPWTFCAGMLAGIVRREGIDLIHASNTTAGDLALLASQRTGVPYVLSLHNTISNRESQHACLKEARRIIVFDAGAAESAGKFTQEFDTSRIVRVPRPVEHRPAEPAQISPLRLAYVARLSSRKGKVALSLLEAFSTFARERPGASLVVIGDGSRKKEVAAEGARIERETGARIEVRGQVLEPHALLKSTGVLVGAGYAALEAVMQGRAVIGAGFNGYGAVTAENVLDAIGCNFGDTVGKWEMTPENFLASLRSLAAAWDDPQERSRYWGLDRVVAPLHGVEGVAARLEEIYRATLGQP